ncbi:hypothetical protein IQ07DRAFT_37892 [Pyrenochaeta sp. DS3sAY3a]|nr:hypothetical protein IQ07DRAFT_37892 [Pyrenochaeta sp. DS3sAY3a]
MPSCDGGSIWLCAKQCNGQPYMGCCYPDQNCLTINGNHACCPTNFQTCGNTMCTYANSTCCANTPGMACGPSQNCCGEGCCDSGYSCCTGSGGTKCCDNFDSQCCGGVCCPTSRDCCGDVCCDAGWTCETRGRCVRKTTARVTFTTTTTSLVRTISTDAAALGKKIGESLGVVGGLLAAGFL